MRITNLKVLEKNIENRDCDKYSKFWENIIPVPLEMSKNSQSLIVLCLKKTKEAFSITKETQIWHSKNDRSKLSNICNTDSYCLVHLKNPESK